MCGRFALISNGEIVADQFQLEETPTLAPRYNIAPTQPVAAIRLQPDSGKKELTHFQWGLVPFWAKDPKMGSRMINARSETVAEKPAFRAAFKYRRCLIPVDGFYEWQKQADGKQPIFIYARDGQPLALAGLWETWSHADGTYLETCTILTTTPNDLMAPIHNRMPVIIEPADYEMWLDPGPRPNDALHLLRPYPDTHMATHPVSKTVNNPRHDVPECIVPLS